MDKLFLIVVVVAIIGYYFYKNPHDFFVKETNYYLKYTQTDCIDGCTSISTFRSKDACINTAGEYYNDRKFNPAGNYQGDTATCFSQCPLTIDPIVFDEELCNKKFKIDLAQF